MAALIVRQKPLGDLQLACDICKLMSNEHLRLTVIRRVRLRDELKPMKAPWLSGALYPDWAAIAQVTGKKGYELFELLLLKRAVSVCAAPECASQATNVINVGSISYDTLQIAKGQAHADLGIEYVEWEPCKVDITEEDGSLSYERLLPIAEPGASPNGGPGTLVGNSEAQGGPPSVT